MYVLTVALNTALHSENTVRTVKGSPIWSKSQATSNYSMGIVEVATAQNYFCQIGLVTITVSMGLEHCCLAQVQP